jgi:hypothetical protein
VIRTISPKPIGGGPNPTFETYKSPSGPNVIAVGRPEGIYFAPREAPTSVQYFDFATKHVRRSCKFEKNFVNGLSVSPDGRWLLYTQLDKANSDIMLVEHFR